MTNWYQLPRKRYSVAYLWRVLCYFVRRAVRRVLCY